MTDSALIPMGEEWTNMKNMAGILVKSGFLPVAVNSAEKAIAIMLKGRELKIPPMHAFAKISIIQGVPTTNAELQLSLVRRDYPEAKILFKKTDKQECIIDAARPGDPLTEFRFTIEDAKDMGLIDKSNWKKMPRQMLKWRCVSDMCRTLFPECLMGVSYTPEEIDPDLLVDAEGNVLHIKTSQHQSQQQQQSSRPAETVVIDSVPEEPSESEIEAREKKLATARLYQKLAELRSIGFKDAEVNKALKINSLDDLLQKDSKAILAALEELEKETI